MVIAKIIQMSAMTLWECRIDWRKLIEVRAASSENVAAFPLSDQNSKENVPLISIENKTNYISEEQKPKRLENESTLSVKHNEKINPLTVSNAINRKFPLFLAVLLILCLSILAKLFQNYYLPNHSTNFNDTVSFSNVSLDIF